MGLIDTVLQAGLENICRRFTWRRFTVPCRAGIAPLCRDAWQLNGTNYFVAKGPRALASHLTLFRRLRRVGVHGRLLSDNLCMRAMTKSLSRKPLFSFASRSLR